MLYIYNKTTGEIKRRVNAPISDADANCFDGESWIFDENELGDTEYYVLDGALVKFTIKPSDCHSWNWDVNDWIIDDSLVLMIRGQLKKKVEQIRDRLISSPILYNESLYDADERAITNLQMWRGEILPDGFVWRDADNQDHIINSEFIDNLLFTIAVRGTHLYQVSWSKKSEIDALDYEGLMSFDIDSGWG